MVVIKDRQFSNFTQLNEARNTHRTAMKVLLLLAAVIAATQADISEILRGSNDPEGRYYHDTSGGYVHDQSGRYVHDDSGRYVHVDNPYVHDVIPHPPYEHVHVPHPPYEHVHVPHPPYEHVHVPHPPYEHVVVPHVPYEHVDSPYVHQDVPPRRYLPPEPPGPPPYRYEQPEISFPTPQRSERPKVPLPTPPKFEKPRPVFPTAAPSTIRPFVTPKPTAAAKGGGPYRWNLIQSGEHEVEHPEYKLQVGLHPHVRK